MELERPVGSIETGIGIDVTRGAIRRELGEAIPTIVERDRFLQRTIQLVAQHAHQPFVAIYTRGVTGHDLVLRASTLPPSTPAPARLTGAINGRPSIVRASNGAGNAALIAALRAGHDPYGALVVFQERGFTPADQARIEMLAEEIAPAVAVAEYHHAVKQASILDLPSGAYAAWFLKQRLDEEIERAGRAGRDVTLLLLEVHGAEATQAHPVLLGGADPTREMAAALTGSTRMFDVIAQRGPGQFAVLLVDARRDDIARVVARIEARLTRALARSLAESDAVSVVASHAAFPVDGLDATTLFMAAEHRLDEALRRVIAAR